MQMKYYCIIMSVTNMRHVYDIVGRAFLAFYGSSLVTNDDWNVIVPFCRLDIFD